MKRTRTTRLLLMGLSPVVLAACDLAGGRSAADAEYLFPSADACIESGQYAVADCQAAFATAWNEHQATAPRYESEQACVEQHGDGACTTSQTRTGSSSFIPFMAGMMMGRAFNTGFARPAYYGRGQTLRAGSGQYWPGGSNPPTQAGAPGARALPPPPAPGRLVTRSRAGFGHSYAARGAGG